MTTPHSIAEFTDPEVSPANNRVATVSYASRFEDHQHIPAIIMKGQWLEAAGFATGQNRYQSNGRLYRADRQTTRAGINAFPASG
jgi:hypothetical protein